MEVRLELRPSEGTAGRATGGCLVTFAETDADGNGADAILAFRAAHSGLCNGEQAPCWSELCGRVVAHRRHGSALLFVDLRAGDETVQAVFSSDASDAAFALATRRGSLVRARGVPGRSRRGEMSLFASSIAILRLPPEADAVLACARLAAASEMSVAAAARLLGCDALAMGEVVHAVETAAWDGAEAGADDSEAGETGPTAQRAARELASALAGRRMRARPARYLKAELGTLDRLAAAHGFAWPMGPESSLDCRLADLDEQALGDLHPARGLPPVGEAEAKLRAQYIERKKLPQLRWMLAQIDAVIAERCGGGVGAAGAGAGTGGSVACGEAPLTILDLGCGRADLTLLLAARYPSFRVVGLDSNDSSLQSAVARAQAARLSNVSFLLADAAPQATGEADAAPALSPVDALLSSTPDVLVALHACGGLSDVAMGLAARWRASAVVCSCCFNKHRRLSPASRWGLSEADKDVLCRMADCELPALSAPARHLASSLRLRRFQQDLSPGGHGRAEAGHRPEAGAVADARAQAEDADEMGASLAVRFFDPAYSTQNTVLVARVRK